MNNKFAYDYPFELIITKKRANKHAPGQHDQKTHGGGGSKGGGGSVGSWDDVTAVTDKIDERWRQKYKELDKHLEEKGLTRAYRDIESDPEALKLRDEQDAIWKEGNDLKVEFYNKHFSKTPETEEFQKLRDKYVVADAPTLKMNRQLREGGGLTQRVKDADALCASGEIKNDVLVYRGAVLPQEMLDNVKVNSSFIDKGFQSTDLSKSSAEFYAETRKSDGAKGELTLFNMTLKKGVTAVNVNFGEIVVKRLSKMVVTGKSTNDKYTIIDVEVSE